MSSNPVQTDRDAETRLAEALRTLARGHGAKRSRVRFRAATVETLIGRCRLSIGTTGASEMLWTTPLRERDTEASRDDRIRHAGELWLRNYDMRLSPQLWMTDLERGVSFAFRRTVEAGVPHGRVGPLALQLAPCGDRFWGGSLVVMETDDPGLDRLFETLCALS